MSEINDLAEANRLLDYLTRFEDLMAALALAFIDATPETLDSEIDNTLRHLADFANVRRAYLLLLDNNAGTIQQAHVWGDREFRRIWGAGVSVQRLAWLMPLLQNGQPATLYAGDIADEAREEFGLNADDTMMAAPLLAHDGFIGFIGMDWSGRETQIYDGKLLAQTAAFITGALERQRSEQARLNEFKMMRALIDNVPEVMFAKDTESRFLLSNYAHAQEVGMDSPDVIRGKTDFNFFPEEMAQKFHESDRVVFNGKVIDAEEMLVNEDGTKHWVHVTKVPFRDEQGTIIGLVGISRNITERKRIEESMRSNERLLRTVIDNMPALVYVKDRDSRFLLGNTAIALHMGLQSEQDLLGKSDADFHPTELANQYRADEITLMESGEALLNHEEPSIDHDTNSATWYSSNKIPLRAENGEVIGLVGINYNITERKRMEDELKNKERLLRVVIDNLPGLIFVKDIESKFMLANKVAIAQMGMKSEQELIGKSDADFHPPDLAARYRADELEIINSGHPKLHYEEQAFDQSHNELRWLSSNKIPIRDENGKVIGLVGINHDITERKRIEEDVRRKEQLLRIVIDNIPSHVYVKDMQSRFMLANKACLAHMGVRGEQDLLGKTDADFHPGEMAAQFRAHEIQIMATGEPLLAHEEESIDHSTGAAVWLYTNKIPLRDENGKIIGLVGINHDLTERRQAEDALRLMTDELGKHVEERTAELQQAHEQYAVLQEQIIESQKQTIQELSTPVIPILDQVIVMPLVGTVDSMRARDLTRAMLAAISQHRAKVVLLDITGVSIVDTEVANHLNKTMQAARLKGAATIVTGISDAVAETIVDLGIDWTAIDTLRDLRSGLRAALERMGFQWIKKS